MSEKKSNFQYQIGGSLSNEAPTYVYRGADREFYQHLVRGEFCYVLTSRQMGKSSLRVRTMQKLIDKGIVCGFIDLTGIGSEDITPQKWYAGMVQMLVRSCDVDFKWRDWWRERRDVLSPLQCFAQFIEEVLLGYFSGRIVIFIDEIDYILSQQFPLDEFFAYIRFCWEQKRVNTDYDRLTFALLGVASPSDLIQDKTRTPFNIGHGIELQGFQLKETAPLINGLAQKWNNPEVIMEEILNYTGGQPFLTQKLCKLVLNNLEGLSISEVVHKYIINNWESQDEPVHLRTIRDRILLNDQQSNRLLGLYQQVLQGVVTKLDNSSEQQALLLSGLVLHKHDRLQIYNPIYAEVFNKDWVEQQLASLRPYSDKIKLWIASDKQDNSYLLRGDNLQDVLRWSLGKSLSNEDYQFLSASQELAKEEIEQALTTTQQANHFLARARRQAEEDTHKYRLDRRYLGGVILGATLLTLLLRSLGLFQGWEWALYDQFVRYRSLEASDSRIVIVTIDDNDIEKIQQWPIPDRVLADTLEIIKEQNPLVIGLDIYRNLPVEPGNSALMKLFRSIPNLYAIEKTVNPEISPPPILKENNQVGFADQVLDNDGKVRRALLSVSSEKKGERESLALKLAEHYLMAKNIEPQPSDTGRLIWGKASFDRFQGNDGGYVGADDGGYQIFINFRGEKGQFVTIPLRNILARRFPKGVFRGRIVLLGSTAESLNDFFFTPYNGGRFPSSQRMAGVVVHANIISQIISAVVDGRALINTWNESLESFWVLVWAGVGGGIGWMFKDILLVIGLYCLSLLVLLGICYLAFLWGWWLPLIPCLLSGGLAMILMLLITANKIKKQEFIATLRRLSEIGSDYPIAQKIALESLKNSVNKSYLVLIKAYFPDM